ncbi:hypothetical protein LOZ12_006630 [Ophidiomyces ophidiicola]|uniref:uncharacterized protein n=1 Tax=Ophidiomyces ophidiicola TaxID=1387563 RepID=UPI0020C26FEC|nr:uncharacterized protein LOZ57_006743 [Ophidiomyces ophidiicola]KAI1931882.1 hypothetical protein LOZ62_006762 [Ophidiomyces ophidiicola]KAI1936676.1 hypothetical protein LOZ57_006743 [Ophidiomyces ophidiicola]KAI1961309.1 hypothetical protein LOZ56_006720 [Ophidiomyces ophidiicola]KAI1998889.1 hypothetical protein LOZ50_006768 [Ophidiomyces ophidiicola]KAI2001619.1 hypothetical protein LOZ49_006587 [Ophidiomyces ophidiicola]
MDTLATVVENASDDAPVENIEKPQETKFQKAILAWRSIDLANLVSKLDTAASDIVAHQRDSLVQRKDLAQKTKDFRKLEDASKLAEYKALLKSYQAFIDLLTTHGKSSSSAFLQLYSALSEAPDPYPLLEASIDSLVLSEDTLPKLKSEKDTLQKSVSRLTSQLDTVEKKLEEERSLRRELERQQKTKLQEVEASWNAVLAEKTSNWEAKEKSYEEKAENNERLLKEIKASYEVSQRLDSQDGGDAQRSAATAAELEILSTDLEKTSLRLADVEARNEQLRLDLAQAISHSQSELNSRPVEEDPAYLRLQSENSSLLRKLDSSRFDRDAEKNSLEAKVRQIERLNTSVTAERDELRGKLEKFADYDDIRRELEVIKTIEFSTGDDDDVDLKGSIGETGSSSNENNLEQLLMARNKKLSDELTVLRVSHRDLETQLETLREEVSKTNADLERSRNLTASLENDIIRVQKEAPNSSAMSVAGTYASRHPYAARRGRVSPTSSIISGFDHSMISGNNLEGIRSGDALGGGSGILPMVQAQRDRFKKRNSELEQEISNMHVTIRGLRQEIASLQEDNLGLYEKTRYVSTYNRGVHTTSSSSSAALAANRTPHSTSIQIDSDSPLTRYHSAYEAKISPFARFRSRESDRAYNRMSLPERMIFTITRIVLANRTSRNLFAAYCLALHVLVFVMLYSMSTIQTSKHHTAALESMVAAGSGPASGPADWHQEGLDVE